MIEIKNIKKVHCIGIGGIGLSAIADILLSKGIAVSGSDLKKSEITQRLEAEDVKIYYSHEADNVNDVDLIVYSAAVGMDNPEILRAKELDIPIITRAQMLGILMKDADWSIAVAGTHGKTTTTSMVSLILKDAGLDPTLLVGGNLSELGGNVRIGGSKYFVTEACEYMDSFLSLKPKIEIILNIDSDHLDYFRDIEHIVDSFKIFTSLVPKDGIIFAYASNPFVSSVIQDKENVITFGLNKDCDYYASNIKFDAEGLPSYDLYHGEEMLGHIQLKLPGEYNILNSLAAISCSHALGIDLEISKKTLSLFKGTQRRFDILGTLELGDKKIKIIDDYAHHPTEIKAMLKAASNMENKNIWCIFQPHTYTRTTALFSEFCGAFENADKIIFAEIYAAREKNLQNISSSMLAKDVKGCHPGKDVRFFGSFEEIVNYILENVEDGDVVITTGAGDIYKVGEMLLER